MSSNTDSAEQKLIGLLRSAASYNDKGVEWSGHTPEKAGEMQLGFQQDQLTLVKEIGGSRLGETLLAAIESGAASRDWSGVYASLAEQVLGVHRHGP